MKSAERQIEAFVLRRTDEVLSLLERLVNIQSGTSNKTGVDAVSSLMAAELESLGFSVERHRREVYGDHIVARRGPEDVPTILLVGHTDTVYPPEEPFQQFRIEGERCMGQGVIDMKGGLACMVAALRVLEEVGALDEEGSMVVLLNSDEEVGSVDSGPIRDRLGRQARCALILECGGKKGEVVTARRGQRTLHLQVEGRAQHAGSRRPQRANAIHELAHKVMALEKLTDLAKGRSINVGRVRGGIGSNTLAAQAEAWIDVRYLEESDGAALLAEIKAISRRSEVDGCKADLRVRDGRPAWLTGRPTERLLAVFQDAARELGRSVGTECRWGVSDANDLAALGVAVLDGLGPLGGKDHTPDEYCWISSLTERSSLLAAALARMLAVPGLP
jgi:glutamate carboxypeptidase